MARKTDPLLSLPDKSGVLYVRLYQRMRALILDGRWKPGTRLPSSRALASDLGISRNTASLALDQLLADGWIESRPRAGMFVADGFLLARNPQRSSTPTSPGIPPIPFELAHGAVDAFPFGHWARLQGRIWSRAVPNALYEGDPAGDFSLRDSIARIVAPARGITCTPNQIILVSSTQSALDLIGAALGAGGREVVVEDPGYPPAHAALVGRGLRPVPIRVDHFGIDVAAARAAAPSPALIVLTPSMQFPLSVTLAEDRREALSDWAAETGAWIVEDDYDADARFDGQTRPSPLKLSSIGGWVIYVASFSRMLFRSLRLGFMIVPDELIEPLLRARTASDGFVTMPNQLVLHEFIEEGGFSAHLRRCRQLHEERRNALLALLEPYRDRLFEPEFNVAGLHLIARPIGFSAAEIAQALGNAGFACLTVAELARLPDPPDAVLLGFAAFSPDVIEAMRPAFQSALDPFLGQPASGP